ncbi:hypothetical protein GF420_16520 [candidate division GN15 bacterium]|nr:hypothetical protein [candidate division GN15 bacterium]
MTAIMMFLPPRGGFAANVNVQTQYYAGNMNSYIDQSVQEIERMGWTIDTVINTGSSATIEYHGKSGGRDLYWYARVLSQGKTFYLVTATGLASRWEQDKDQLIESVDSFSLIDSE